MTLAVTGSRSFTHYASFCVEMDRLAQHDFTFTHLISGGALGTDRLAERYAVERKLALTVLKPNWRLYGRKAGHGHGYVDSRILHGSKDRDARLCQGPKIPGVWECF